VANQQLNLKNILLNSLAHDISSPLTSLGLVVEQIATRKDTNLSQAAKDRALKNLTILSDMLASVRSLSRLQMHKEELKTNPVSIKTAVEASIAGVQEAAAAKNVVFNVQLHENDPYVMAHESTFVNNVMPNVLSNAIKFSPTGGTIKISSSVVSPYIVLSIEDEGGGFTDDEIKKFNSGITLQSSIGTEGEVGSGLGLTQVKGFMELYNGQVLLANSDKGAAIKLRFRKAK
jgi:signal transduction histidine kinase